MKVLIIDGQGGQLGAQLVKAVGQKLPQAEILAVGTNATAARTMSKAGAKAASGENSVLVACRHADVILGPIGIVIADSMLGEVTPKMAVAIGQSEAVRILLPMNRCDNLIAGLSAQPMAALVEDAMQKLLSVPACRQNC